MWRYFIGYAGYCSHRDWCGVLLGNFSMACFGLSAGGYDNIAEESVLHLRVYRV